MSTTDFSSLGVPTPQRLPRRGRGIRVGSHRDLHEFQPEMQEFVRWMQAVVRRIGAAPSCRTWLYLFSQIGVISGKDDFDSGISWLSDRRKAKEIPFDLIGLDRSRPILGGEFVHEEETPYERLQSALRVTLNHTSYRPHSYWDFQSRYPIVWCEKLDIVKMLEPVIPGAVHRLAGKGWSDINTRVGVIELCREAQERGLRPVILYFGDLDPAGVRIADFLRSNLEELAYACEWDGLDDVLIRHVGLTAHFVGENNLPWIEGLKTGSGKDLASKSHPDHRKDYVQNYLSAYGARKVELNALVLCLQAARTLLKEELYKHLSLEGEKAWVEANAAADAEMQVYCEQARRGLAFLESVGAFSHRAIEASKALRQLPGVAE
jgi:hypothetical protein